MMIRIITNSIVVVPQLCVVVDAHRGVGCCLAPVSFENLNGIGHVLGVSN